VVVPGAVWLTEIVTTIVRALTGGGFDFSVPVFSGVAWIGWLIVGGLLIAAGVFLRTRLNAKDDSMPLMVVVGGFITALIVAIWVVPFPVPAFVEGTEGFDQVVEYERAATTTTLPWTVIAIVAALAYVAGRMLLRSADEDREQLLRRILVGLWVISFPVIVLVILRDPEFDFGRVFSWYVPVALGFIVGGGLILRFLVGPTSGERGRVIAALLVVLAISSFFISMEFVVRFGLLSLSLFALASPTFGGEGEAETRYIAIYAGWIAIMSYIVVLIASPSTVLVRGDFFLGGLALTFLIAISGIAASFPIGVILALGRTSTMPIFRLMSTTYIEVIRGVPLITWLLVGALMLPVALPEGITIAGVMRAIVAVTFFSAAYLAENIRGGLQSIPKGQYEAAQALGMSTVQTTVFITMPQALRAVIPALVGQVIALFKDTSLVTIIGLFDFLHISRAVIPVQTQPFNFLGSIKETLVFAAIVYWIFTFTFSRVSLRLERKLGVGVR
jgi:general L-amino acid transport system permease protein